MKGIIAVALLSLLSTASGAVTAETNYNPVSITVSSAPFDILATPITPDAPYSQAAFQCNVTGDSRYPPYASGTFPLNISVPVGQRVRVIFANGNLNGATVTQQGEPGVIVQQGGSPIVQQAGGASPIVQNVGSPIVQQSVASPAALVVQQGPTVVQQDPGYPQAAPVPPAPQVIYVPVPVPSGPTPDPPTTPTPIAPASPPPPSPAPATPASSPPPPSPAPATPAASPPPPSPAPATPAASPPPPSPAPATPAASPPPPMATMSPPPPPPCKDKDGKDCSEDESPPPPPPCKDKDGKDCSEDESPPPPPPCKDKDGKDCSEDEDSTATAGAGRKLLQDTVPGGPNNGLVEYVALASANTVPGFYAGSTQFGVPYIEFTASEAARGQVASFRGVLEVAQVVGGVPLYPFRPNPSLSPECQTNVNFVVA